MIVLLAILVFLAQRLDIEELRLFKVSIAYLRCAPLDKNPKCVLANSFQFVVVHRARSIVTLTTTKVFVQC